MIRTLVPFLSVALIVAGGSAKPTAPDPARIDRDALGRQVAALLDKHGDGAEASVWLGGAAGPAWFERDASIVRPTASAVKVFFLIELFDRFKDRIDAPTPGADAVVRDDAHPAVSHFTPAQRADIRRDLTGASVRHLGRVMVGTDPASNHVYNAAANVVTAVLGGPEALTAAIRKRDEAFRPVAVRRYMLRDRKTPGDNEATAAALAAAHRGLAAGTLAGLDAPTRAAVRDALKWKTDPTLGTHYAKDGFLGTDPLTVVQAGWWETAGGPVVYVVMAAQPTPGMRTRTDAGEALTKTAKRIEELVVAAGRRAAGSP